MKFSDLLTLNIMNIRISFMFQKILLAFLLSICLCTDSFPSTEEPAAIIVDGQQLIKIVTTKQHAIVIILDSKQKQTQATPFIETMIKLVKNSYPQIKICKFYKQSWKQQLKQHVRFDINQQMNYPTIYFYDNGYPIQYSNIYLMNPKLVVTWIKKYKSPDIHWIQRNQTKQLSANQRPYFICESKDKQIINILMRFKFVHERFPIFCIKQVSSSKNILVAYHKNFTKQYIGDFSLHSLFDWFQSTGNPPILRIQSLTDLGDITNHPKKLTLIFQAERQKINTHKQVIQIIQQICQVRSHEIQCGYMDPEITAIAGTFYQRLKVKRRSYFIALLKSNINIGYLFDHSLLELNEETKQQLNSFIDGVISNNIKPTFDTTIPKTISYQKAQILTNQTFNEKTTQQQLYFVKFTHPLHHSSRSAFKNYQKFAERLKQKHNITAGVIDCSQYRQFCQSKNIKFYPEFVLFAKNTLIIFSKHQIAPNDENLLTFVGEKINNKIKIVSKQEQILDQHCLIFEGAEINDQISSFALSYSALPTYFVKKEKQYFAFKLFLVISGDKIPFPNRIRDLQHSGIIDWVKRTQSSMINHLSLHQLQKKESLPRFVLLYLPQNARTQAYEGIFGYTCKKLEVNCRYIVKTFFSFNKMVNLLKLKKKFFDSENIFYVDQTQGTLINYEDDIKSITPQKLKVFIETATEKNINQLQGLRTSQQKMQLNDL